MTSSKSMVVANPMLLLFVMTRRRRIKKAKAKAEGTPKAKPETRGISRKPHDKSHTPMELG